MEVPITKLPDKEEQSFRTAPPNLIVGGMDTRTGLPVPSDSDQDQFDQGYMQSYEDAQFSDALKSLTLKYGEDRKVAATPQPGTQVEEKEPGLFGNISKAWEGGKLQIQLANLRTRQLYGETSPAIDREISRIKGMMEANELPRDLGFIEKALTATAKMIPIPVAGMQKGLKEGLAMGAGAAAITALAGQAGPQALFPEEIVTVPAAFMGMFGVGMTYGTLQNIGEIEAGLAYDELIDLKDPAGNPLDPDIARAAAAGVGVINGLIELSQIKMLTRTIPGGDKLIRKITNQAIKRVVTSKILNRIALRNAAKYGGTIGAETLQEVAQESTNVVLGEVAKELTNELKGTNFAPEKQEKIVRRLVETAKESAMAFGVMGLPGAAATYTAEKVKSGEAKTDEGGKVQEPPPEEIPFKDKSAIFGKATDILHEGGKVYGQYAIVELEDLQASHVAGKGFQANPKYPAQTQERLYDTARDEQLKVIRNARTYNPDYTVNTDPTLVNGPPAVTGDGIVLGGNSRIMSLDMVYREFPEQAAAYRNALETESENFGYSPEDIAQFKQPVLVRVLETGQVKEKDYARLVRLYNQPPTHSVETRSEGVSKARMVSENTLGGLVNDLEKFNTLREYMGNSRSRGFIEDMLADGILDRTQLNKYLSEETGLLTEDGKRLAEQVIMGKIFEDAQFLKGVPAGILQKIDLSLPAMIRIKARGGDWDIIQNIRGALSIYARMRSRGYDTPDQYFAQGNIFEQTADTADARTMAVLKVIAGKKPTEIKNILAEYAAAATADVPNQATFAFYKPETPGEAFGRLFGPEGEKTGDEFLRAAERDTEYGKIGKNEVIPFKERSPEEKKLIEGYNKKMDSEEWKKAYENEADMEHFTKDAGHSPLADELLKDLERDDLRKNAQILEIGSGQGRDGIFLAEKGHIVRGIDVSEKAVKIANEEAKGKASFEVGDAENLYQFEDASQDAVYSVAALHGTPIKFTFQEIFRVLKPGGQAKLFLYTKTKTGNKWVSYWTPGEIKQYAKEAGFKVEKFREGSDIEPIVIPGVSGKVEQETHLVVTTFKKPSDAVEKPKTKEQYNQTTQGQPGNLILIDNNDQVYESAAPLHALMLDEIGIQADQVKAVGLIDKDGTYLWTDRDLGKRLNLSDEVKGQARQQYEAGVREPEAGYLDELRRDAISSGSMAMPSKSTSTGPIPGAGAQVPSSARASAMRSPEGSLTTRTILPSYSASRDISSPPDKSITPSKTIVKQQPHRTVDDNLAQAQKDYDEYLANLEAIAAQVGGRAEARVKDPARIDEKLRQKNLTPDGITDYLGGRIDDDPYAQKPVIEDQLRQKGFEIIEEENYFQSPTPGGYRGINYLLRLPSGHIAEFQIHFPEGRQLADKDSHQVYEKWRSLQAQNNGRIPADQVSEYEKDIASNRDKWERAYQNYVRSSQRRFHEESNFFDNLLAAYPGNPMAVAEQMNLFGRQLQTDLFRDYLNATALLEAESVAGKLPKTESGVRTLGVAIAEEMADTGRVDLRGQTVKSADDLAVLAQVYRDPRLETLRLFYVKDGKIVAHEGITSRMPNFVKPFIGRAEQVRFYHTMKGRMERLGADGYYMLHNHPSGRTDGSTADAGLTHDIDQNVPGFLAHVIIDFDKYHVIRREDSLMGPNIVGDTMPLHVPKGITDPLLQPSISNEFLSSTVTGPEDVAKIGRRIKSPEGFVTIIYRNAEGKINAIQEMPVNLINNPLEAANWIRGQSRAFGSSMVLAYGESRGGIRPISPENEQYLIQRGVLEDIVYGVEAFGDDASTSLKSAGTYPDHKYTQGKLRESFRPYRVSEESVIYDITTQPGDAGEYQVREAQENLYGQMGSGRPLADIFNSDLVDQYIQHDMAERTDRAVNIALKNIKGEDDIKIALQRIGEIATKDINEARRNTITNEETLRYAEENGMTARELINRRRGQALSSEEITAARLLQNTSADGIETLRKKIRSGQGTDLDRIEFKKKITLHYAIQTQVSGAIAEAGRALQALRILAGQTPRNIQEINQTLDALGGRHSIDDIVERLTELETPAQKNKLIRDSQKAGIWDVFLEAWINALLTGPQTHVVNTVSNSLVALWQIPERFLAAEIGRLHGSNEITEAEAMAQCRGMVEGAKDGLRLAWQALKTGESQDIYSKIESRRQRAISSEALGIENETLGKFVDGLGGAIRSPGRLLMTMDEFYKSVGYRMELHAQATRAANMEGLSGRDAAVRIQEILNNPPAEIRLAAMDNARYQTFTGKLDGLAAKLARAGVERPWLKLIMPFVRTPVNIMNFTIERTPLGFANKRVRADIMAGGARADLALARMAMGSMVMASVVAMAAEGLITGGGPQEPELKKHMRETGWQPYSLKIGDTYYSYARLEPLGALFGMAADAAEIIGQRDQLDAEDIATAIVMSVARNITSKTYLRGVTEFFEVMSDPDRYGERYVQKLIGTVIPTGVAQLERTLDPTLSDARSILDQIRSRVPGWSKDLPPRRNLWGDPILLSPGLGPNIMSPVYTSKKKSAPIDEEIIRLRARISMPTRTIEEVPLTPQEYSRYVEMAGNAYKNPSTGLGCKEALMALIKTAQYKGMSDGPEGGKAAMIKDVIQGYRQMAAQQMKRENSELSGLIYDKRRAMIQAKKPLY